MSYIGASDLVFNSDDDGINSGGFNVKSLLLKMGMSPIITLNKANIQNGGDNVSDIFNDLVVPNWALYHPSKMTGGSASRSNNNVSDNDSDSDSENDTVDDNLHDQLLDIVKHQENMNAHKKKHTKKGRKSTRNTKTKTQLTQVK